MVAVGMWFYIPPKIDSGLMKSLLCLVAVFLSFLLPTWAQAAEALTLWVHPYLSATELTTRFTPLTTYLSEKLNRPVLLRIQQSYQAHVDFVGSDQADIAYLGPASYVTIKKHYGTKPLLAKVELNGKPFFYGMIITRNDSGIQGLADLAGKSFAFGDFDSTMSYLVPLTMLAKAGITKQSFSQYEHLRSHHDVALAVLGEYLDAGAVKEEVFYEFESKGLRMLAKSPPIAGHVFVASAKLPAELTAQIRTHLLNITSTANKKTVLSPMADSVTGLLPVVDQDYDTLRDLMQSVDQ